MRAITEADSRNAPATEDGREGGMTGFVKVNGWIVVGKELGVCYESFARTRGEAIEKYVGAMKLWSWEFRDKDVRVIKIQKCASN